MFSNLPDRVEQLARTAVLTDSGDLQGLVALQEQAVVLATDLGSEGAATVAELATKIGDLAEAIVLRKVENADTAFKEIGAVIEKLQTAINSLDAPAAPAALAPLDREMISTWIAGCDGMLSDLEGCLLAIERNPTDAENVAEVRRILHTIKGECGVLSLHTPQKLCHEAESLIDAKVEAKQPLPIDPFLMLMDWLKVYVTRLSADMSAQPENHEAVLAAILEVGNRDAARGAAEALRSAQGTENSGESAARGVVPAVASPVVVASVPAPNPVAPAPAAVPTDAVVGDTTPLSFGPAAGTEENLPDFLCEAKDHIAASEEALLALDQDRGNIELINTVFRAFHTIKGVSGFMALKPIVSLAHSAEQLLDGARSGTLPLGRTEMDLVLASCDMMTKLIGVLEGSTGPARCEFDSLVAKLNAAAVPGNREQGTANSGAPSAAAPAPAAVAPVAALVAAPVVAAIAAAAPPSVTAEAKPAAAAQEGETGSSKIRKADQTVKVNTTRMDNLVTMVGELVIAQQMVVQDVAALAGSGPRIQRTLSHMGKMIRDLQEVSMSLRMVNLKNTFQKMTRLVRDVSQKANKQIEVTTDGEDVELDRNVVEAITDPLVHMIRNACDHGVEGGEERKANGKSPVGHVALRAYHAGGSIIIEIADDGRGLRREKLLAKAKSKGILPADHNDAAMPDSEVFNLIFLPGFSTAEKVTDISGRGVGMDVVRRNIEALRGKVEIRSTPGQGTTFLMRLPLTMAIIDGMVVRVGNQRYVLPTLSIQQSFRPKAEDVKTAIGCGEMVRVRGNMLPIYRLNRVLQLKDGAEEISDALLIVMEADDARFCLLVDEILGQHQVVIKTLTQTGQQLKGVSGGAILGDGRVALILDVAQVVSLARDGSNQPRRAVTDTRAFASA